MEMQSLIITLVLGAAAGWLGGQLFKGSGLGLIGNIVVGIVGGFIGYWLLPKLGLHINTGTPWLNYILTAGIGAVVLLALLNIIFRKNN
ncbi:MAG TPA: GlsB/YeaQ/YmgE family stress response membrane protein [Ferruginibacter sp.]|nr:GlsB/YeaQ/YmgE family stress response membrane protein [Ferruginibacter sp.]